MKQLVISKANDYVFNSLGAAFSLSFQSILWDQDKKNAYEMWEDFHPDILNIHYTQFSPILLELIKEYKITTISYGYNQHNISNELVCIPPSSTQTLAHINCTVQSYCLKHAANILQINKGFRHKQYVVDIAAMMMKESPTILKKLEKLPHTINIFSLCNQIKSPYFVGNIELKDYRHVIKSCKINLDIDGIFKYDYSFNKCFYINTIPDIDIFKYYLSEDSRKYRNNLIEENYELSRNETYLHRAKNLLDLLQLTEESNIIQDYITKLC